MHSVILNVGFETALGHSNADLKPHLNTRMQGGLCIQRTQRIQDTPWQRRPWEAVSDMANSEAFDDWIKGHLDDKVTWM